MNEEAQPDPRAAAAEAYLRANGVAGITINGSGEDWFVSIGFAEHERFVAAYSAKNPLTPTDPMYLAEQALAALIRNERPVNKLAQESEAGEAPRTYDEATAEYFAEHPDEKDDHDHAERSAAERDGLQSGPAEPEGDLGSEGAEWDGALDGGDAFTDAEFDEPSLGAELLEDDDFAHAELPAPEPEDFAPEELEPAPSGAFIFGDNLAHDRIIRIGQLSEHASALIEAAKAGYSDSEHDALRSHVVTNMNEAGAYVGGRQDLFDRFIALEAVTGLVRRIEIFRDLRQDFVRSADREAVAAFEPEAGWP